MQVDSISNVDVHSGRAVKLAISVLAAVAVAAAAGLATLGVSEADMTPHVLKTDASAYGLHAPAAAETPAAPASGELDPALQRPDPGSDQHG